MSDQSKDPIIVPYGRSYVIQPEDVGREVIIEGPMLTVGPDWPVGFHPSYKVDLKDIRVYSNNPDGSVPLDAIVADLVKDKILRVSESYGMSVDELQEFLVSKQASNPELSACLQGIIDGTIDRYAKKYDVKPDDIRAVLRAVQTADTRNEKDNNT